MYIFAVISAVVSNILFSLLFFYGKILPDFSGIEIFSWRIIATLPSIFLFVILSGYWKKVKAFFAEIGFNWRRWLLIILPTPIMAGQLCLFMWAPLHGRGIDVAIGYFLFPLAMALGGVICFAERLNRTQQAAIALAALGVLIAISQNGAFSWVSFVIFSTYPIYYLLRRYLKVPALIGLFIDMLLVFPFALIYLLFYSHTTVLVFQQPSLFIWIIILGIHSATAMQLNLTANHYLPVVLFSMLSYLEPTLLFIIAVLCLNEPLIFARVMSYSLIGLGIALMIKADMQRWRSSRQAFTAHKA